MVLLRQSYATCGQVVVESSCAMCATGKAKSGQVVVKLSTAASR